MGPILKKMNVETMEVEFIFFFFLSKKKNNNNNVYL